MSTLEQRQTRAARVRMICDQLDAWVPPALAKKVPEPPALVNVARSSLLLLAFLEGDDDPANRAATEHALDDLVRAGWLLLPASWRAGQVAP